MKRTYDFTTTGWNITTDVKKIRKERFYMALTFTLAVLAVVTVAACILY